MFNSDRFAFVMALIIFFLFVLLLFKAGFAISDAVEYKKRWIRCECAKVSNKKLCYEIYRRR
jgi:hypothetical protein